jgi:hypothetical protein
MRVRWLIVGTIVGIVGTMLLLPAISDETGALQSAVVILCPLAGLGFGFLLDSCNPPSGPQPFHDDTLPNPQPRSR